MEHYRDPLVDMTDEDLRRLHTPELQLVEAPNTDILWWQRFKDMDRYDWNDPGFLKRNKGKHAFLPIPLTQGFFMIVPKRAYRKMTKCSDGSPKKWCVKIDRDKKDGSILKVYAMRRGRKEEPRSVYAHRELLDVLLEGSGDVDHINGWSLDNRGDSKHSVNLDYVSTSLNGSNALRARTVNIGLPRGVQQRGKNKKGQLLYRGIRAKRLGKNRVLVVRSKRTWLSPEPAARWYQNQLKKIHKRTNWAHAPLTVNYPVFPPTWESKRLAVAVPPAHIIAQTRYENIGDTF